MRVCAVVPWRGGCEYRERAFAWLRAAYPGQIPDWDLVTAEAPPGPWIKAAAVTPALEACEAEIVVVHDADVWCEGLREAVAAVAAGAPWAVPHRGVYRLSEAATADVLAGAPFTGDLELVTRPYLGRWGGGIVVARRETLLEVPLDPRFAGWGQEDESWGLALHCLAGRAWRGRLPLWHLYHPPQERLSRRIGSRAGKALNARYAAARSDPDRMRQLLSEVRSEPDDAN